MTRTVGLSQHGLAEESFLFAEKVIFLLLSSCVASHMVRACRGGSHTHTHTHTRTHTRTRLRTHTHTHEFSLSLRHGRWTRSRAACSVLRSTRTSRTKLSATSVVSLMVRRHGTVALTAKCKADHGKVWRGGEEGGRGGQERQSATPQPHDKKNAQNGGRNGVFSDGPMRAAARIGIGRKPPFHTGGSRTVFG